jgi:hypothetical protein
MEKCPFYETQTLRFVSNEISGSQQSNGATCAQKAWCKHPHSSMPERVAMQILGRGVTCCGDVSQCQVPAEVRGW